MKPEKSRWNLLLIIQILKKYSNAENPLSASEICNKVNREYGEVLGDGENVQIMSADTVKRTLDDLVYGLFGFCGREAVGLDYDIYCVKKTSDRYEDYGSGEDDSGKAVKKYYYYESKFTLPEIKTLVDAIEAHSYFSEEDVCDIVQKLIRLRPYDYQNKKYYDSARDTRDEDSLLLMNIDLLNGIIGRHHCAVIEYCAYNENKELALRPGYPRKVEPMALMWGNGYYYMLAYNEKYKNPVSYRVDRIRGIEELAEKAANLPADFNPVKYRQEHPIMYTGEKERCVILCRDTGRNYIMNVIMDMFGKKARVSRAEDALLVKMFGHDAGYYADQGITWLKIVFESVPDGMEMWATQYCTDCVVVSPEQSRKDVMDRLRTGMENYSQCRGNAIFY